MVQEAKAVAAKKRRASTKLENLGIPEEELLRQQQELFAKVGDTDNHQVGGVARKVPLCSEWVSYQKKDGRAWPSFFWYDNNFFFKSRCHTMHAHPSFGMTTTQDIKDLFA